MKKFRISFGVASCKNYKNSCEIETKICREIINKIEKLKLLNIEQLLNFKDEEIEVKKIDKKKITFTLYKSPHPNEKAIIVTQAFYTTWLSPNYISFTNIGKIFAEGIVITTDGTMRDATDNELWDYR